MANLTYINPSINAMLTTHKYLPLTNIRAHISQQFISIFILVLLSSAWTSTYADALYSDIPVVLTPTRLKQSLADTPASVSIITQETIKDIGANSIVDIFRLIPGMSVHIDEGNDIRLNFHSGNRSRPRRLQVLIDGVPVYGSLIAEIDWATLPITLEDIDRIEVTRSPNTAAYGANAFNGVINIITQHPTDQQNLTIKYVTGAQSTANTYLHYNHSVNKTMYKISYTHSADEGVDLREVSGNTAGTPIRDGHHKENLNIRTYTKLSDNNQLELFFTHSEGDYEVRRISRMTELTYPDIDREQQILSAKWSYDPSDEHNFNIRLSHMQADQKQRWIGCPPMIFFSPRLDELIQVSTELAAEFIAGNDVIPTTPEELSAVNNLLADVISLGGPEAALTETCGHANLDSKEKRSNLELQDTYVFSENLRIVTTLGHSQGSARSESQLLNDKASIESNYFLTNIEYKPNPYLTYNIGGIWENETFTDTEFSPRIAANLHINRKNTIRLIHSEAIRTPDLLEQKIDLRFYIRDLSIPVFGQTSAYLAGRTTHTTQLLPERITANELSYLINLDEHKLNIDIKLFEEKLEDLISSDLAFGQIDFHNNDFSKISGLETEILYKPTDKLNTRLSYANFDHEISVRNEAQLAIDKTIAALISYEFNPHWQSTFLYAGFKPELTDTNPQKRYAHIDIIISAQYKILKDIQLGATFKVRNFIDDNSFIKSNLYEDDTQYFLGLNLEVPIK